MNMLQNNRVKRAKPSMPLIFYQQGSVMIAQGTEAIIEYFSNHKDDEVLIVTRKKTVNPTKNHKYISYKKIIGNIGKKTYDLILIDHVLNDKNVSEEFVEKVHGLLKKDGVLIAVDKFYTSVTRYPLGKLLSALRFGLLKKTEVDDVLKRLSTHFKLLLHAEGNFAGDRHLIQMRKIVQSDSL